MFISTEIENGKKPTWSDEELTKEEVRTKAYNLAEELRMKGGGN